MINNMNKPAIKTYGNKILRVKASKVQAVSPGIKKLVKDMVGLMYQGKGVGLAAPQVGVSKRIIIFDIGEGLKCLINPEVVWKQHKELMAEGCLSFPGISLDIKRWKEILVTAMDVSGKTIEVKAEDMVARVIQHEIDHLDGVLIIDRVSAKELKPIKTELEKLKKSTKS